MTFKMEITSEMAQDENVLVEKLYAFLNEYVHVRLKYEGNAEKEDCVQDSIMYLLKRYNQLEPEIKETINLGKFFYNRAHSFISGYISKLKTRRSANNKYIERELHKQELERLDNNEPEYVDYDILNPIISSYKLSKDKEKLLKEFSEERLKKLGYDTPYHKVEDIDKDTYQLILTLSYAVIDEYMINSTKGKASEL